MKRVTLKIVLTALAVLMMLPAMSQKGIEDGSKYGHGQDSINCLMNLSLYKEFFKHNNYSDAIQPWRVVFAECPASSQNLYVDGVKMYKSFISKEKNPDVVEGLIDTLMLIYDRRFKYFNDEANVLGRKATDLLRYRKDDIESVEEAYGYLSRSIEIGRSKARDAIVILFVNSSVTLVSAGVHDNGVAIEDYFTATGMIDEKLAKNSKDKRWLRAKESVDNFVLDKGILGCDALNEYYSPLFEANKDDQVFLNKVVDFYSKTGCDRADLYVSALENLYKINPTSESAYLVANLFLAKQKYDESILYFNEAIAGDADNETKALYYYKLAQVTRILQNYCSSISNTKEAIKLNPNYGEAYLLLGDNYIDSRTNLEDQLGGKTAYWAAVDKYKKSKEVDSDLAAEANKKIADYSQFFPDSESCFFLNLEEGKSYNVKGCINEYTVIKYRK